jgi:hypothetical protein
MLFALFRKKTGRVDVAFELFLRDVEIILRSAILAEKVSRNDVDAFIGTLRREDGSDEELEGVRMFEFAVGVRVGPLQAFGDRKGALLYVGDHGCNEARKVAAKMQIGPRFDKINACSGKHQCINERPSSRP